jgi:hypothetical protein
LLQSRKRCHRNSSGQGGSIDGAANSLFDALENRVHVDWARELPTFQIGDDPGKRLCQLRTVSTEQQYFNLLSPGTVMHPPERFNQFSGFTVAYD